jgi:hypothetical protein
MDLRLPNLFLIGAMKSGTTTLAAHLVRSPDVAFLAGKEPQLFNQPDLDAVRARLVEQWRGDPGTPWILDATPNYTRDPDDRTPEHIAALVETPPRFVYLLRDPVERTVSHYFWDRELSGESLPFAEAVARNRRYIDPSLYDVQIERYFKLFDPTTFLFVKFETFVAYPGKAVAEILGWLSAAPAEQLDLDTRAAATDKTVTRVAWAPGLIGALRANRWLVELGKSLVPERHHRAIMRRLTREVPREAVAEADKDSLRRERFLASIARTEALTGLDLSDWRHSRAADSAAPSNCR